jgi:hypothetical protein
LRIARAATALLAPGAPFLVAATIGHAQPPSSTACGKERWPVKTLTDPAAASVDLTHPSVTTVEKLRRLRKPATLGNTTPRLPPVETQSYRVKVLLMSMIKEDDRDIHLVVADPTVGGSMIVEFPDESCTGAASIQARQLMAEARSAIAATCGGEPGRKVVTLRGEALMTGVGFFDKLHGQGGLAPNGIELHPVIGFESTNCRRA